MTAELPLAAPDLLVFEVTAVVRREVLRRAVTADRGAGAIEDLGHVPLERFPSLSLRVRAWELHPNMSAGDALFVTLAERLDEPLATADAGLPEPSARTPRSRSSRWERPLGTLELAVRDVRRACHSCGHESGG